MEFVMDFKTDPRSVSHLIRGWRHRTLTLLTRAGVIEPRELIEKTKLLEEYFLDGNFKNFEAQDSETLIFLNFKMSMVSFYLGRNISDIPKIIQMIDELKPYFLDHIIDLVKNKPLSEIMESRFGANFY